MKKGDIRRTQILDASEKLFFERGYDRTSVQDILDALQMSKGGFYHYFDAKDSVLQAVSERRAQARFDKLNAELRGSRRTPVEKLNLILGMTNLFEAEETRFAALLLKLCYRDHDAAIRDYRRRVLIDRLLPQVDERPCWRASTPGRCTRATPWAWGGCCCCWPATSTTRCARSSPMIWTIRTA